jgi:hypothetical protein
MTVMINSNIIDYFSNKLKNGLKNYCPNDDLKISVDKITENNVIKNQLLISWNILKMVFNRPLSTIENPKITDKIKGLFLHINLDIIAIFSASIYAVNNILKLFSYFSEGLIQRFIAEANYIHAVFSNPLAKPDQGHIMARYAREAFIEKARAKSYQHFTPSYKDPIFSNFKYKSAAEFMKHPEFKVQYRNEYEQKSYIYPPDLNQYTKVSFNFSDPKAPQNKQ